MAAPGNSTATGTSKLTETTPPSAIILPTLACLTCLLSIPPLVAHLKARNLAATILVMGILVVNFQNFINALIWPSYPLDNKFDGRGLCDVEVKLELGVTMAVFGATVSIFRQLALVLDTSKPTIVPSRNQRYKTRAFEVGFCLMFPAYTMIVHYAVQPNRYYLLAVTGCLISFYENWITYVLINMWPAIIGLIAAGYCILAIYRLIRYRRSVSSILSHSSTITRARYIRLFALAAGLLTVQLPLAVYSLARTAAYTGSHKLSPYSWSAVHPSDWSTSIMRLNAETEKEQQYRPFDRWAQVAIGFLLFVLFGLGQEAIIMYKSWLLRLGLRKWWPALNSRQPSTSTRTTRRSGPAELGKSHSSRRPIRDAVDMELESIDRDLELGQYMVRDRQASLAESTVASSTKVVESRKL